MSAELLLLHDHASSVHEAIKAAGLTSSCSSEAELRAGNAITDSLPANQSSPLGAALLPPPASLPHLSRLLRTRGASSPSQPQGNGRGLFQSQSETAIVRGGGSQQGNDSHRWRGQTTTAATRARARPRSAGVARRWPGNSSSRHSLGLGPGLRRGVGTAPATGTNNNVAKEIGLARGAGRIRPMSAPGRRPEVRIGPGGPHFAGPIEVNAGCEGQTGVLGNPLRTMLGGWSAQDVLDRNAGELSRGGLLCLVRALRENLGAGDGHIIHGAPQLGGNRGSEMLEEEGGGRPDAQTLLREQTRRYNDLRIAYASLCRRLEKGRPGAGSRSAGVGQARKAKLARSGRGSRERTGCKDASTVLQPETNVEGGMIGSTA